MEQKQNSLMAVLVHDLLSLTFFLISHPLHLAYLLFFSPYLLSLLSFLYPLLISTSLFLLTLVTISPYLDKSPSQSKHEFLGKICGIVLNAICTEPNFVDYQRTIGLLEELDEMVLSPITRALVGNNEVSVVSELFNSSTLICDFESIDQKEEELVVTDNCKEKMSNCAILENGVQIKSFSDEKCEILREPCQDKGANNGNVHNSMELKDMDQEFHNAEEKIPINVNIDNSTQSTSSLVGNCAFLNLDSQNSIQSYNSSIINTDLKNLQNESFSPNNDGRIGHNLSKAMSLNRREHARSLSQGLQREGSMKVEKEWKRTLACKLYEERMSFKLREERPLKAPLNEREGEGEEEMDLLWEAIEVNSNKSNGDKNGLKSREKKSVEREEEESEEEEGEDEGHVRQLCCLQALRVSTRKMNIGVRRPNLVKLSKVLKKMSIFHGIARNRGKNE